MASGQLFSVRKFTESLDTISCILIIYTNLNLTYTNKQDVRINWLAPTGIADFGKEVQLISGSAYDATEQFSQLTRQMIYMSRHDDK